MLLKRLSAVSVDRGTIKLDPFRERNPVLFQGNEKYKTHPPKGGFCVDDFQDDRLRLCPNRPVSSNTAPQTTNGSMFRCTNAGFTDALFCVLFKTLDLSICTAMYSSVFLRTLFSSSRANTWTK